MLEKKTRADYHEYSFSAIPATLCLNNNKYASLITTTHNAISENEHIRSFVKGRLVQHSRPVDHPWTEKHWLALKGEETSKTLISCPRRFRLVFLGRTLQLFYHPHSSLQL